MEVIVAFHWGKDQAVVTSRRRVQQKKMPHEGLSRGAQRSEFGMSAGRLGKALDRFALIAAQACAAGLAANENREEPYCAEGEGDGEDVEDGCRQVDTVDKAGEYGVGDKWADQAPLADVELAAEEVLLEVVTKERHTKEEVPGLESEGDGDDDGVKDTELSAELVGEVVT